MANEDCKQHDEYLAKVPREVLRKRLELFHLKPNAMDVKAFICRQLDVRPPFTEYRDWMHTLKPESLDDLKNWFGIPNEAAERLRSNSPALSKEQKSCAGVQHEVRHALPMMRYYEFESLEHEQQIAVRQTANALLYGYVDAEMAARPPLSGVINYMLAASANLKIFVAPDLVVCPDNIVSFEGVPVLLFNNILIYGNGQITTGSRTKIHAHQIRHVDV